MMKKVAFHTLGCKLNYSETSSIARSCEDEGYEKVDFKEKADIYVLNTCSVTENADKECKRLVRQVLKINSEAFVVIIGCFAQLKPEEISKYKGVDLVLEFRHGASIRGLAEILLARGAMSIHGGLQS